MEQYDSIKIEKTEELNFLTYSWISELDPPNMYATPVRRMKWSLTLESPTAGSRYTDQLEEMANVRMAPM